MGGLRQEALRRTAASPGLRGPLYAPRSHLQRSHPQHRGRPSNLSLQGLSPWQPAQNHDLIGGRVHPSLPATCLARGLSPYSLLWFSRQPPSQRKTGTVSSPAGDGTAGTELLHRHGRTGLSRPLPGSYWFFPVGMPRLSPWVHDRNRRDPTWQHSANHRHLMRTIAGLTLDSALHQLAFSKSKPMYSCSRLQSWFAALLHLGSNQSKSFLGHPNYSTLSASTTSAPFSPSGERFNTHRTVAAQRFSSIHF